MQYEYIHRWTVLIYADKLKKICRNYIKDVRFRIEFVTIPDPEPRTCVFDSSYARAKVNKDILFLKDCAVPFRKKTGIN
jgi:hypothetical protein